MLTPAASSLRRNARALLSPLLGPAAGAAAHATSASGGAAAAGMAHACSISSVANRIARGSHPSGSAAARRAGAGSTLTTSARMTMMTPVPAGAVATRYLSTGVPASSPSGAAPAHTPGAAGAPALAPEALLAPAASAARRAAVLATVRAQAGAHHDAFYVVDLGEVAAKHAEWRAELPRVRPFYAVKCNDDPHVVATLARLGCGMDCASKGEMSLALKLGVAPSDIIFAHPAKQLSHIAYARAKGVTRMTFDNEDELRKIGREYPGAEAVLRILTDDSASVCRLGLKFGAPLESVPRLMRVAREAGVNVVGISYHVGSGNGDASAFGGAVRDARKAFDMAAAEGFNLRLLDIGGGYPGSELGAAAGRTLADTLGADAAAAAEASGSPYSKHPTFRAMAAHIREALDECFPEGCGVELIAEPGRYFVRSSHALAVTVTSKRVTADEAAPQAGDDADAAASRVRFNYYANEGLYSSFNCILYDHVTCAPSLLLTTRPEALEARAAEAALAADEDALARLSSEGGRTVVQVGDAGLGMRHAADLAAAAVGSRVAAAVAVAAAQEQEQLRSVAMGAGGGGSSSSGGAEDTLPLSAAAGMGMGMGGAGVGAFTASRVAGTAASASASASVASAPLAGTAAHGAPVALGGRAQLRSFASAALPGAASTLPGMPRTAGAAHPTTVWGPTCDSIDKISDDVRMPELQPGDWLVYENMGAYTAAGSCRFNGFPLASKVYIHTDGSVEVQAEEVTE